MANLSVENLGKILDIGDAESLVSGPGITSEAKVHKEMARNGMEVASGESDKSVTFTDLLRNSIDKVNQDQQQADTAIKELLAGRSKNIHETLLAVERADASLKLMMQVRNKVLDAYKEIMRMQV